MHYANTPTARWERNQALNATVKTLGDAVIRARHTDPATSHAAADSAKAKAAHCRANVHNILSHHPEGLTLAEIVELYAAAVKTRGWRPYSDSGIRTRTAELADRGLVIDTGRRARMNSGRHAIIWATKENHG